MAYQYILNVTFWAHAALEEQLRMEFCSKWRKTPPKSEKMFISNWIEMKRVFGRPIFHFLDTTGTSWSKGEDAMFQFLRLIIDEVLQPQGSGHRLKFPIYTRLKTNGFASASASLSSSSWYFVIASIFLLLFFLSLPSPFFPVFAYGFVSLFSSAAFSLSSVFYSSLLFECEGSTRPWSAFACLPSGYVNSLLLKITIEIVDFPMKNGGSFHSYVAVYQRVSPKNQRLRNWVSDKLPMRRPPDSIHRLRSASRSPVLCWSPLLFWIPVIGVLWCFFMDVYERCFNEGSLEVKLPTMTDGKAEVGQVREKKGRKKIREEKESEERRCRCAKR